MAPNDYKIMCVLTHEERVRLCKRFVATADKELVPAAKSYNASLWQRVRKEVYGTVVAHAVKKSAGKQTLELCKEVLPELTDWWGSEYPHFIHGIMNVSYEPSFVKMTIEVTKTAHYDTLNALLNLTYLFLLACGDVEKVYEHFAISDFMKMIGRPFKYW